MASKGEKEDFSQSEHPEKNSFESSERSGTITMPRVIIESDNPDDANVNGTKGFPEQSDNLNASEKEMDGLMYYIGIYFIKSK